MANYGKVNKYEYAKQILEDAEMPKIGQMSWCTYYIKESKVCLEQTIFISENPNEANQKAPAFTF